MFCSNSSSIAISSFWISQFRDLISYVLAIAILFHRISLLFDFVLRLSPILRVSDSFYLYLEILALWSLSLMDIASKVFVESPHWKNDGYCVRFDSAGCLFWEIYGEFLILEVLDGDSVLIIFEDLELSICWWLSSAIYFFLRSCSIGFCISLLCEDGSQYLCGWSCSLPLWSSSCWQYFLCSSIFGNHQFYCHCSLFSIYSLKLFRFTRISYLVCVAIFCIYVLCMWGIIMLTRLLVIGIDECLVVVEVIMPLELWSLLVIAYGEPSVNLDAEYMDGYVEM